MTSKAKPIPEGHDAATPYLCVKDAAGAIAFYKKAFGATETLRLTEPGGKIGHAEIRIGRALVMLADEYPEMGFRSPQSIGGTPVKLHLYVDDVDAFIERAAAAGAKVQRPVKDEFYGDRSGQIADPYGHEWMIATNKEIVPAEEMQRRFAKLFEQ